MADGKKIGAKIVLDGEAEFRQSINNSKSALKQFDSELKLTQAQFKGNEKSMQALQKVQQTYVKQQNQLQKQEKSYVEQLEKASKAHKDATKVHEETAKNISKLKDELEKAKKQYGENSNEVQKLNSELEKSENQYKKEETAISGLESKMSKWETGLNETRTALVDVNNNLEEVNHDIEHFDDAIEDAGESTAKANPELNQLSLSVGKLVTADLIAEGIKRLASAVKDLALNAVDVGMQFEASMSQVAATMGITSEEIQAGSEEFTMLEDAAKQAGETTMFSASQSAEALNYLALAGYDAEKAVETLPKVLDLAAAGGLELAYASDVVTDAMSALGLETDKLDVFIDEMAKTSQKSNTSVAQLGEATLVCAGAVAQVNMPLETMNTALGILANNGLKGAEGGTHLRNIILSLTAPTDKAAKALKRMGIDIADSNGDMRDLQDILEDLNSELASMGDVEKSKALKTIFNKTDIGAVNALLKSTNGEFVDLQENIRNSEGAAKDMATTMQDNLKGKITILQSALEGLGIAAYEVFDDSIKTGIDGATDAVGQLTKAVKSGDLNTSLARIANSLDDVFNDITDWMEESLPDIIDGIANVLENADKIVIVLESIVAGFIAFKTATTVIEIAQAAMALYTSITEGATLAQLALNAAVESNPIGLLAGVIAGVATGIALWISSNQSLADEWEKDAERMVAKYKQVSDSIKESAEDNNEYVVNLAAQKSYITDLVSELSDLQKKMSLTSEEQARSKEIVAELNTLFPDLNLQIEEQTGKLTDNTDEWKRNIDILLKKSQVAAIEDRLTEAYKEQIEAETNLYAAQKDLDDITAEYGDKLEELEYLYSGNAEANQTNIDRMNELSSELEQVIPQYNALQEQVNAAQSAVDEHSNSIQNLNGYLNENQIELAETSEATTNATGEITADMEEWTDAYADAYEAALKSLSGQSGLFTELSLQVDTSISQMTSNLNSQTEVFSTFASDLQKASELANKSSDPEFKAIVANIESMGVDGAGYLHELVAAAETDSEEFNELMKSWAEMQDAKSTLLETMATFEADFTTGVDTLSEKQIEFNENFTTSNSEMLDTIKEDTETKNGEIKQNVEDTMTGIETAIENAQPIVQQNSEELANAAKEPVESTINHDTFYEYGEQAGQGLADGLRSMVDEVRAAAQELADAANTAVSGPSGLDEHSPSKKMHEYGRLGGVGLAEGFEESLPDVVKAINNTLPNENNVNLNSYQNVSIGANTEGNGTLAKIENTLNEYLPVLSQMKVVLDTGTTVGALASPMNKALGRLAIRSKSL